MSASQFLVPQHPISDPKARLSLNPIYVVQHGKFSKIASEPISQDVFDRVVKAAQSADLVANQDLLGEPNGGELEEIYRWKQTGETIRIWWTKPAEIKAGEPITVTETSISSPVVCGNFFGRVVGDAEIKNEGDSVEILIKVDGQWPLLIKDGENVDRMSLFYVAGAATRLDLSDEFELLLAHSGMNGCVLAASTLGYFYSQINKDHEALYWFTRFAEMSNQDLVLCVVARILMETKDPMDAFLAENLLIMIANEGEREAIIMLGQMHIERIRGFKSDPSLAAEYFQYAVDKYNDQGAMASLGKLYAIGVGVEKDVRKAVDLFRKAGLSEEEIVALSKNQYSPFEIPEEEAEVVDIAVSAAIVSVIAVGCYFGFKFLRALRK